MGLRRRRGKAVQGLGIKGGVDLLIDAWHGAPIASPLSDCSNTPLKRESDDS